jgi:hypothetical protein
MNRDKNNRYGLLELLHLDSPYWNLPAGGKVPNTFHHIGLVVPDVKETQARLEKMGATIIKGAGEAFVADDEFAVAAGFEGKGVIGKEEMDVIMAVSCISCYFLEIFASMLVACLRLVECLDCPCLT